MTQEYEYARVQDLALMSGAKIVGGCSNCISTGQAFSETQVFCQSDTEWDYIIVQVLPYATNSTIVPGGTGIIYQNTNNTSIKVFNINFTISSNQIIASGPSAGNVVLQYMVTAYKNP